LVERDPAGDSAQIIGSINQYLFAPDNRQAVIEALAAPECRIVTLTITEAGYYYIEGSSNFDVNHPTIQHDLHHPEEPIGTFGFLSAALERRRKQGCLPLPCYRATTCRATAQSRAICCQLLPNCVILP
jgi:mannitol 2-dehydrogenase